jgi:hypothetical protein
MLPAMLRASLIPSLALAALVAACAPTLGPPPPPPEAFQPPSATAFRHGDFAWSAAPGKNLLVGHLAYRQAATRYSCAGGSVILTPETPWTRRRMIILYASPDRAALPAEDVRARTPSAPSGDYSAFVRRSVCDATEHFSFSGLPDGAWYAITIAKPVTAGAGPNIALMRRVTTRGGRTTSTEL